MTLRFKLLVLVAAVTLFAATGVTAVALWREVMLSQDQLSCEGAAVAASIAPAAARWLDHSGALDGAAEGLRPALERTLEAAPLVRAWVVDANGAIAACVDRTGFGCPPGAPLDLRPPGGPVEALRRLVRGVPLEASAPVVTGARVAGAVRLSYRPDRLIAEARGLASSAAAIAGAFIVAGLLFATVLVRRITRPLSEVVHAAEALVEGQRIEVKLHSDPELNDLVSAFNLMSARLLQSHLEMEQLISSLNERVAVATEEGLRAERLVTLGGIAAGFAHEMGNSLNVISGFTSIVLRELPKQHPHRTDLETVKRESGRAAAMLERFLLFARSRPAKAAPQPVEPVLREAVEVAGPAAAEARVTTSLTVEPGLPDVRFDPELVRQAFLNLCVNAIQAMGTGGGRLDVRAVRERGGVAVEFQDSGPGIDPEIRERIFEPFFTTKANGTGLGLAIVRHAAEAHGGSVDLPATEGPGALFRIHLPSAEASP